jgi:hypothetical protein
VSLTCLFAAARQEKRQYLVQFLSKFVAEFADTESDLVELRYSLHLLSCNFLSLFVSLAFALTPLSIHSRFGGTRLVARDLVWHFISHISELCQAGSESTLGGEPSKVLLLCPSPTHARPSSLLYSAREVHGLTHNLQHTPAALIFEYLSGLSREGEGFYLLWTLEILSKNVRSALTHQVPVSFSHERFELTRTHAHICAQVANARIANGLATTLVAILVRLLELPSDFLLHREGQAHYPHAPTFYAFHFPAVSQLFAVEEIPTCLGFLPDTISSPSSSSSSSSPSQSGPSSSALSPSSLAGGGGASSAYGLGGMPGVPAHAMLASLCYHMLSLLAHLFKHPGTLKELVQYKKLSAFVGLFKPLSGAERRSKQKASADRTPPHSVRDHFPLPG